MKTTERRSDHGDEDHPPKPASATRSTGHRVKFHREDLKNKFSLYRHNKPKATEDLVSKTNTHAAAAAPLVARDSSSLTIAATPIGIPPPTPEPSSNSAEREVLGANTEERRRWFKKIFKHKNQSGSEYESISSSAADASCASSSVSFQTADEYDDDDVVVQPRRRMSRQTSTRSSESGWSVGAKSCEPAINRPQGSLRDFSRAESDASPPGTMSRFKSKFRLRKSSDGSSASSCMSADSTTTATPVVDHSGSGGGKLTRASSTGTLASNCGAMSRRSYRIKLDHALQKAHLRRRNGLVDLNRDVTEDRLSGFMMAPDATDELKVHSAENYQAVLVEAQQMPS